MSPPARWLSKISPVVALLPCLAALHAGEPRILDSGLKPVDVENRPYLDYARECIELLIEHGTDRYGKVHAPILVSIVDVRSRTCPEDPLPLDEAVRVTRRGRRGPAGANLYLDQPLLHAMYKLSEIQRDARYRAFADRYLAYALKNLVDEKGLWWWGWHRHYDVYRDAMTGHHGSPHEIHVQEVIWPELWAVNRDAVERAIEAIWRWHVVDKKTGECNRHGDGQRGCDFAMSGGAVLTSFAFLHAKTGDVKWLERAKLVADYYWDRRHPETDLIPNRPNAGKDRFDGSHFDTAVAGLYCRSLFKAFEWTREPRFREHALAYLKAYATHGYDADRRSFWGSLELDGTPVPGPRVSGGYGQYEPRGAVDLWQPYVVGYEQPVYTAQAYALACKYSQEPVFLVAARRWADLIRRAFPPRRCDGNAWYGWYAKNWARFGTYAGEYGRVISFLLRLHALTGDAEYLEFAREVAKEAVSKLYYRGLFRGHPAKPYYEAVDGVGYLVQALVELDQVVTGRKAKPDSRDT